MVEHTGMVRPDGRWACGSWSCHDCFEASPDGGGPQSQLPPEKKKPGPEPRFDEARLRRWSEKVRARDGACVDCGATENLHAHHVVPKAEAPERAYELENGVALCESCHRKRHPDLPDEMWSNA